MDYLIYHWIDILWLPIAYFSVPKKHGWLAVGFIAACMIMMRMQAELMDYIGYRHGLMGLLGSQVYTRGIFTYSAFYILFLLYAHFSRKTMGVIFIGASLTFFFAAFVVSMFIMVL